MKKFLAVIITMVMVLVGSQAFADNAGFPNGNDRGPTFISQGQGQSQTQSMSSNISVNPIFSPKVETTVKNENKNTNLNTNVNKNSNENSNLNLVGVGNLNSSSVSIVKERELLAAPQIAPWELPAYQNGKIGDYTANLPNFKGLTKLTGKDIVVSVIKVVNGSWLSRIRLEDLEKELIDNKVDGEKVRYTVRFKDSVSTGGIGGGAGGSVANTDGLSSGTGSILPGYHSSTHNPQFIITFYEVE